MALNEVATTRRAQLRAPATAFTQVFTDLPSNPPHSILTTHFNSSPGITEHGPAWANRELPFLGKTFSGFDECMSYFDLLAKTLEFQPAEDSFSGPMGLVVDPDAVGPEDKPDTWGFGSGVVSLVGKGLFKSVKTGRSWEETFIYRLSGFDEEGRIGHWEIWADPLSALMAVRGQDVE